jgi:hypothetical protein
MARPRVGSRLLGYETCRLRRGDAIDPMAVLSLAPYRGSQFASLLPDAQSEQHLEAFDDGTLVTTCGRSGGGVRRPSMRP